MAKKITLSVLIVLGLAVVFGGYRKPAVITYSAQSPAKTEVTIDNQTYGVELAVTTDQQARGLSGRTNLPKNQGMLFPLDPPSQPSFWMKEMLFPLDLVWIRNNRIIDISRNLPVPQPKTPLAQLPLYGPSTLVDNVLELNAGDAKNFQIGDPVSINTTQSL